MMKIIFMTLFMIPLSFMNFWLFQLSMFFLCFFVLMNSSFNYFFSKISFCMGYDSLSYWLIILSIWISSLMVLASFKIYKNNNYYNFFNFNIIILLLSLIMVFSSLNMFSFYLFFEISLLPLMIIILGWGYQPERLMAGMYMIFYTLMFSLPMMVGLFWLNKNFCSMNFFELNNLNYWFLYFFINMVFFVKIPMFSIHLWLPKAHVEAPVAGSMMLAGIMLKLGGYGLIRFMKLFFNISSLMNMFLIILSILGGLIISFICLSQTDIKILIAYSSISHMSLVVSGVLTSNYTGYLGCMVMMISHGLCSSGLFCLANIYYERFNSRSLYLIKGMMNIFPNLSLWMFLLSINNMAAPPSLNLLGEIFLMMSIISFNWLMMLLISLLSFFSALYSIYLYSYSQHGKMSSFSFSYYSGTLREYLLLFLHWFPLNLLILVSDNFNI